MSAQLAAANVEMDRTKVYVLMEVTQAGRLRKIAIIQLLVL